jgi:hypothetical protein
MSSLEYSKLVLGPYENLKNLVPEPQFQETCAGYDTQAAQQNDYNPQEPQRTEGVGMQERTAE